MIYRPNALSVLGRMNYGTQLLAYPALLGVYIFLVKPYMAKKAIDDEQKEWDSIPKTRKVDPDIFSPFTPIPYHNNPELKYVFAHIQMHKFLNKAHMNPETYAYKGFHNSFDHDNKNEYSYNLVSMHGPRE